MSSSQSDALDCAQADELAGATALGALDPDESRAVTQHVATCEIGRASCRERVSSVV